MGTTSKQQTLLEYLRETVLPNIDGTGVYNLELKTISRDIRGIDDLQKSQYPAVFITDHDLAVYTPMTARGYTTGASVGDLRDGWFIHLWGYVMIDTQTGLSNEGPLSEEMVKMFSDLTTAMEADPDLGGNLNVGMVLVSNEKFVEALEQRWRGVNHMVYSLKYDFNPSNDAT